MKTLSRVLLLALTAGFALGLAQLLGLRFAAGDVYPEYSSLRADPLGTKALYESLNALLAVRRNYHPVERLSKTFDSTLFYLGADAQALRFEEDTFTHLEAFATAGGRLIISFRPKLEPIHTNIFLLRPASSASKPRRSRSGAPGLATNTPAPASIVWAGERWGFAFGHNRLSRGDHVEWLTETAACQVSNGLPEKISLRTGLHFAAMDPGWQTIYARTLHDTNLLPVLMERRLGRGSVVLYADSYLFSNEAMRDERQPELLTWLVGPNSRVVFDESHLGVQETPGVATLARKYRLHGLFAALLMLAGLFVWKSATPFMPPDEAAPSREDSARVTGKDTATGFVNLLRRNVPAGELLKVCLQQWNTHVGGVHRPAAAKLDAMQRIIDEHNALAPERRDDAETYRKLASVLKRRKA